MVHFTLRSLFSHSDRRAVCLARIAVFTEVYVGPRLMLFLLDLSHRPVVLVEGILLDMLVTSIGIYIYISICTSCFLHSHVRDAERALAAVVLATSLLEVRKQSAEIELLPDPRLVQSYTRN